MYPAPALAMPAPRLTSTLFPQVLCTSQDGCGISGTHYRDYKPSWFSSISHMRRLDNSTKDTRRPAQQELKMIIQFFEGLLSLNISSALKLLAKPGTIDAC